jgi:ATP-binding cassette subfamily B protein
LLLDEITANLDSITEEKIVSVLQKAGDAHTILSISHRLSSMIASDTVVILENGSVKNSGSPEVLL